MGMFDSLYVCCPACGAQNEFQSKAGACTLHNYSVSDVPPSIAGDLNGDYQACEGPGCDKIITLRVQTMLSVMVSDSPPDDDED